MVRRRVVRLPHRHSSTTTVPSATAVAFIPTTRARSGVQVHGPHVPGVSVLLAGALQHSQRHQRRHLHGARRMCVLRCTAAAAAAAASTVASVTFTAASLTQPTPIVTTCSIPAAAAAAASSPVTTTTAATAAVASAQDRGMHRLIRSMR